MPSRLSFRCILWCFFLLCGWSGAYAQSSTTIRISGNVLKAGEKTPLEDIAVLIKSTNTGTLTNAQGQFSITIPRTDTLVFRAVGYKTVEYVPVVRSLAELRINIYLEEGNVELKEVEVSSRPSQEKIDRYVRNMKRPEPNHVRNPAPVIRFVPEKEIAPLAPTISSPISLLYEMFSNEGKQRQRVRELEEQRRLEDEERRRRHFNRFFKDNTGYE
jgi:hypothetical protein